jgi:hypothetical protein
MVYTNNFTLVNTIVHTDQNRAKIPTFKLSNLHWSALELTCSTH